MKASEMIAKVDRKHDNDVDLADKCEWISDVHKAVYSQVIADPYDDKIDLVTGQQAYDTDGYNIEDILQLKVNGVEYALGSALIQTDKTYFKLNGQLNIKPIPTKDALEGLLIIRRWKPEVITVGNYESKDLLLPDDFHEAYEYYLRSKISFEQKDAAEASAWGEMYSQTIKEFKAWYVPKQPNVAINKTAQRWK